jgi:enterobactin synthetase component F
VCVLAGQEASGKLAELEPGCEVPVVVLDDPAVAAKLAELADAPVELPSLRSSQSAYVMYRAGSIGRPEGIAVTHAAIVNRLVWMQARYPLEPGERVLQKTPFGFDVSVWEFFWPLLAGGVLVVARPGGHRDPAYVAAVIRDQRVSTVHFGPSMLEAFLREPTATECSGLRRVICSGKALLVDTRVRLLRVLPDVELHNLYGPAEASVDIAAWQHRAEQDGRQVPAGTPVFSTRVYVLDEYLAPLSPGLSGELYISGVQLARGYVGRAALTAERFVACPFAAGERMYRTGDRVRWDARGNLEFLGRVGEQVMIREQRIEPDEVEAVFASHPWVTHAAVVAREDIRGGTRLVAYVVLNDTVDPEDVDDPGDLSAYGLDFAARQLPQHMLPAAVVQLDALPLTPNGELDREALPAPLDSAVFVPDEAPAVERSTADGRAPSTKQEKILCAVFAEVLGLDRVGVDDDFFDLGGLSLSAIRLLARIRDVLGVELPLRVMFENPTVSGLIDRMSMSSIDDVRDVILPIRTEGSRPPIFCVHPGAGISWGYLAMARHVPEDVPLYGVQARGLHPQDELAGSLPEMAADYVEQIRAIQPTGPYHLLGWSFGGIVAHEIAVQLQAMGEQVAALVILDTYPGQGPDGELADSERARGGPALAAAELDWRIGWVRRHAGNVFGGISEEEIVLLAHLFQNNNAIQDRHRLGRFEGDALLLVAAKSRPDGTPTGERWEPYVTGEIARVRLPCWHTGILSPEMLGQVWSAMADWLERR